MKEPKEKHVVCKYRNIIFFLWPYLFHKLQIVTLVNSYFGMHQGEAFGTDKTEGGPAEGLRSIL